MKITKHRIANQSTTPYWLYQVFGEMHNSFIVSDGGSKYLNLYCPKHAIWYDVEKSKIDSSVYFIVTVKFIGHNHKSLGRNFSGGGPTLREAMRNVRADIHKYKGSHKEIKAFLTRIAPPR